MESSLTEEKVAKGKMGGRPYELILENFTREVVFELGDSGRGDSG